MKKQEMRPEKDQNRSTDRPVSQDKSSKSKGMEDRTSKKSSSDDIDEDSDFTDFEKGSPQGSGHQQSGDSKKSK